MADNQPAPKSSNEAGENPQKNLAATNGDAVSKSGLWQYLAELVLAGAVGTGVWLFGEHLISHGHTTSGSLVNFVAFCIYFATVPITAVKAWPQPKLIWCLFGTFCSIMACVFFFSSWGSVKAHPHFIFSISTTNSERIQLTNDFLFVKSFGKTHPIPGILFVPIDMAQSNLTLKIMVQNDSSTFAESVETTIFLPTDWHCELDEGWIRTEEVEPSWSATRTVSGLIESNSIQTWGFKVPFPLLAGNGVRAPDIHLPKIRMSAPMNGAVSIMARSKDSPADAINFGLWCLPKSIFGSNDFQKPFVSVLPISDLSPEKLKELQK